MNYNYEEWEKMKLKGLIKFIFDLKNFILMFILITAFTIANLVTRKNIHLTKEFIIHFVFMVIILNCLWILTQFIKWNLYKNIFEKNWEGKLILPKIHETFIGVLSLWIPIGILTSIYGIDYSYANNMNLNYIKKLTLYISIKCILWAIGGTLFELFVINVGEKNNSVGNDNFIIISKYI